MLQNLLPTILQSSFYYYQHGAELLCFLIIINMEPNCCVFPSPNESNFGINLTKILLVPHDKEKQCTYYHQEYLLKMEQQSNEFLHYAALRGGKVISHSNATTKVTENMGNMAENRGNMAENRGKMEYTEMKSKSVANSKAYMSQAQLMLSQKNHPQPHQKVEDCIPCLFLPGLKKQKVVIFFHGNGEDISSASEFSSFISNQLQTSVLTMEYRGYSIYGGSPNAKAIVQDACHVMEFMKSHGFEYKDIILFGRSIGGAIALEVASKFQASSLILLSPFLSLKKIAEDLYGKCAASLIKETLDNASIAPKVECPVLIIHGMKDSLVPYQHSISILGQCRGFTRLKLVPNMTHIKFNFRFDFILPMRKFLEDIQAIVS